MAGRTGLEPATSGVTGRRSNQLNYHPQLISSTSSESGVKEDSIASNFYMNFEQFVVMVGGTGIEPVTPAL